MPLLVNLSMSKHDRQLRCDGRRTSQRLVHPVSKKVKTDQGTMIRHPLNIVDELLESIEKGLFCREILCDNSDQRKKSRQRKRSTKKQKNARKRKPRDSNP